MERCRRRWSFREACSENGKQTQDLKDTDESVMGKLETEHPGQKVEQVKKPRGREGSDTPEKKKGGQGRGEWKARRKEVCERQLEREVGAPCGGSYRG